MKPTPDQPNGRRPRGDRHYLFCEKPRCPECGSDRLKTDRSTDQGDGTRLRLAHCRVCGASLAIVIE